MDIVNIATGQGCTSGIEFSGRDLMAQFKNLEEAWKRGEALLALSHVPCEVKIKVGSLSICSQSTEPDELVTSYLAYCKVKNQWRISIVEETECLNCPANFVDGKVEVKPILECPVDVRLAMLEWFDKLYAEVVLATDKYVPKISSAVKKFEKVLASLSQ